MKNYREESLKKWGTDSEQLTSEQVQLGAILRIADASEVMARNFLDLQNELERYKRWYREEREINTTLRSSNYHLKGHITRLKKKLKKNEL